VIRRLPLLATLAVAWSAAAWFLWQSKVPSSLRLPHVDPHRYFTSAQLHAASSFSGVSDLLWALGVATQVVVLALYAWRGERFARESAAGPMGTGMLLGMLGLALVWLAQVPFTVLDLWWQRRHRLTHVGYVSSVLGGWLALSAEFLFLCVTLAIVMGFARLVGERWWIPAAPVFVGLALLFAFVTPWLGSTHKLHDPRLRAAAARFEGIEGVRHTPVVVEPVRDVTTLPNAEAQGIGPSRRVVLWDTLVDGRFTERELAVVVAHELGHLARHHIWKDVGWYALFAFPGAWAVARVTRRRGGMANPAAVPLSLLAVVVLGLLATPLQNVISRHMEAEADWMALRTTRDPMGAIELFRSFVPTTLDEPSPSTFDYLMLENHPTIAQRIAMAEAWRRYAAAQSP
jgi:STE24 endopeptidase